MKVIAIVGKKKAGKTTLTAALIKRFSRPLTYIYDINNEYTRKFNLKNDYTGEINTDKFLQKVSQVKNSLIVFEEATSYFSSKGREAQLVDIISRSRHTNNVVILIFHSIADFPRYIYTFTDYIGLFKTNDFRSSLDQKLRKNEYFISIYDRVRYNTDQNYFEFFENVN
jgi:molybdopterin-guanine dinucleotide biosynthesis protein